MSEVSKRYTAVAQGFADRLEGVGPDQWSAPTPCTDWNVRDLVAHVIGTHRAIAARLGGGEAAEVDKDGDLIVAFGETRASIEEALNDPAELETMMGGMFGDQTFESLVSRLLVSDTLLHTWDLARATGQDDRLDPDAVAKSAGFLGEIDEAIRRPGGFGPKITPPAGADEQTRLINFSGRAI
jgi:uncharacterized protein (TIGR03086 family)